ncbi:MAG: MFS transporter [Pseudomonadota bacterium]
MFKNFPILLDPEYRKYAAASVLTAIGSGMNFIAMSWFLYTLTGSALSIGWILVISTLPGILFSPWIGALVDRWNTRWICVGADLARGLILLPVALAMLYSKLTVEMIYLATFLVAICDNFFQPAVGALIRNVAHKDRLLEANIVSNMSMQVGGLGGASVGGLLVTEFGAPLVVLINVASFFVSAALTCWIKAPEAAQLAVERKDKPNFLVEFRDTLVYFKNMRFVIWLAVQQMFVYITLYICNTLLPVFVDRELHAGAAGFGIIDAAWGAGALMGGLSLTYLARKCSRKQFGLGGLLLMSAALLVFLTSYTVQQAAFAYLLLGFLACVIRVHTDTIIVSEVNPAYFGKVKATIAMFISYVSLAVYVAVGYAGDRMSVRYIYLALGLVIFLAFLATLYRAAVAGGRAAA